MENIWCRAVWKEDDQEEEGVIPSVWVKENTDQDFIYLSFYFSKEKGM